MTFPHRVKLYRLVPAGQGPICDELATSQWTPAVHPSPIAQSHRGPDFGAAQSWIFKSIEEADAFRSRYEDPSAEWMLTREHVLADGAPRRPEDASYGVKMLIGMNRLETLSVDSFHRYWLDKHAAFTLRAAGTSRYTIAVSVADEYSRGEPLFDGIAELWWRTFADHERYVASPVMAHLGDDVSNFVAERGPFWSAFAINTERWGDAIVEGQDQRQDSRQDR